jgi:HsdM N-terminal domain
VGVPFSFCFRILAKLIWTLAIILRKTAESQSTIVRAVASNFLGYNVMLRQSNSGSQGTKTHSTASKKPSEPKRAANELDYVEQTSWVLFLKYLHDLENERRDRAELDGEEYIPIIDGQYRWDLWAAPKKER